MLETNQQSPVPLATTLYDLLKPAFQKWGRHISTDYPAFQDVVALRLACVEQYANTLVRTSTSIYAVANADRLRAVWYLIREVINMLRPPSTVITPIVCAALDQLAERGWPRGMTVPPECHHYVVLTLAYVFKACPNKEIAAILNVPERTLAHIRNAAVAEVAERFASWELQQTTVPNSMWQFPAQ